MILKASVIHERLRLMRDLLNDLDSVGEVSVALLREQPLTRHAVERIITQLVDLAVSVNSHVVSTADHDVPTTYRDSFAAAAAVGALETSLATELAPSAGMRNVLTHEYVAVDLQLVVDAVPQTLTLYRQYVAQLSRYVAQQESQ